MNKAIYPGSFDPFTYGHMDTVRKAAKLFDEVYILIGVNSKKKRNYDTVAMKAAIEQALLDEGITYGIVSQMRKKSKEYCCRRVIDSFLHPVPGLAFRGRIGLCLQ